MIIKFESEQERQEVIAATLAWCNERRKEKGDPPLTELPKGKRYDGTSCPCGNACGLYVGYNRYFAARPDAFDEKGFEVYTIENALGGIPQPVMRFVRGFDQGLFPEYMDSDPWGF